MFIFDEFDEIGRKRNPFELDDIHGELECILKAGLDTKYNEIVCKTFNE